MLHIPNSAEGNCLTEKETTHFVEFSVAGLDRA